MLFKGPRSPEPSHSPAGVSSEDEGKSKRRRPRLSLRLTRGADGRLKPEGSNDIGDVWAEQQRIRLQMAIQDDEKRKATKKPKKEVKISLSLPRLRIPKLRPLTRVASYPRKRLALIGGVMLGLMVLLVSFRLYPDTTNDTSSKDSKKEVVSETIRKDEHPTYATLLPEGKTIEQLGGWARISPHESEPVFAYADKIGDVGIIVSQQPLPKGFKPDVATHIADLAKQFTANEKLTIGDITAFLGTSIKGPQSVIFTKDDLLILIKSTARIDNQQWGDYIRTLKT